MRLWTKAADRPVDSTAILAAAAASLIIVVNALFLQSGPHTAPFVTNPASPPHPPEARAEPPTGTARPSDTSARPAPGQRLLQPASTRGGGDPIGDLIGSAAVPRARLTAAQRALSDFGYGPIRPSGVLDEPTSAAISRFEADHKMPVTGRLSDRLFSELATLTGRPIP